MEHGGIGDRPDNMVDVFHTHFGVAGMHYDLYFTIAFLNVPSLALLGLSLLGYPGLVDLDPVYCMPASIIEAKGLRKGWQALERRNTKI